MRYLFKLFTQFAGGCLAVICLWGPFEAGYVVPASAGGPMAGSTLVFMTLLGVIGVLSVIGTVLSFPTRRD